jgi:hypothetical protein
MFDKKSLPWQMVFATPAANEESRRSFRIAKNIDRVPQHKQVSEGTLKI